MDIVSLGIRILDILDGIMPDLLERDSTKGLSRIAPWRIAWLGWLVTILVLIGGVPLFLSMPPWNDVTLHDMAVRSMLHGGVHYRDVFDTNLPGIDWLMAGVRLSFGWSYEALRAADLVVVGLEAMLLLLLVRQAGGTSYSVAWLAASLAMLYPFTSEFCHMQRDPWLLFPALIAVRMRMSHVLRATENASPAWSILEGIIWGAAVWIKPHVIVPAFAVWLVSAILISRQVTWRTVALDLVYLLIGGALSGGVGVSWLLASGAWPYFLDVFLNWNPGYLADMWPETLARLQYTTYSLRPWNLLHFMALPCAILAIWEARAWSRHPGVPPRIRLPRWLYSAASTEQIANARVLLSALYLGWFLQSIFLQKGFEYVQVPLLFLGMTIVASQRWAFGFVYFLWFALVGVVLNVPALAIPAKQADPLFPAIRLEPHPLTVKRTLALWPRCWSEGGTPEIRDQLGQYVNVHCGTNWEELEKVAEFLRAIHPPLGPGELNCWHDSTHPLYLMLNLSPATRYMHYGTVFAIRKKASQIADEVAASPQRYVVSDLMRTTWHMGQAYAPGADGDPLQLPSWFPLSQRDKFPWNQPIVFRSGRYLVHKVENPLGVIDIPDWKDLESLGPGK